MDGKLSLFYHGWDSMFEITVYGDRGLRIQFGDTISAAVNEKIRSFSFLLEKANISGVVEWIPTYTAISIVYDPYVISYDQLKERVQMLEGELSLVELPPRKVVHIPVCYGGEMGPDLHRVAEHNGLVADKVTAIHSKPDYLIYMMGFTPGFPYLGGMSEKIATPRLKEPRRKIPAGSVGIAGSQTGIYSIETPGGWQLIGRTPVKLYDVNRESSILLQAGNYIRFEAITEKEYRLMEKDIQNGSFKGVNGNGK